MWCPKKRRVDAAFALLITLLPGLEHIRFDHWVLTRRHMLSEDMNLVMAFVRIAAAL